ncbi:MAG: DUF2155 domain-containing protein [Dongiaceae bacterium]
MARPRFVWAPVAIVALALTAAAAHADPYQIAVLQALDKVSARVSVLDVPVGQTVAFGTLEITARACDKRPPEETPESAAFLEIVEKRPGEAPATPFIGWMFASSPALSAMEHPVYDVWVLDCKNASSSASETSR